MRFRKDQVFGAAAQKGIRAFLMFGEDEEVGGFEAADQNFPHLRRGFAAGEAVHEDPPDRAQLPQTGVFDGRGRWRIVSRRGSVGEHRQTGQHPQKLFHPFPAFRASSSWYSMRRPVRASSAASKDRMSPFCTRKTRAYCLPSASV